MVLSATLRSGFWVSLVYVFEALQVVEGPCVVSEYPSVAVEAFDQNHDANHVSMVQHDVASVLIQSARRVQQQHAVLHETDDSFSSASGSNISVSAVLEAGAAVLVSGSNISVSAVLEAGAAVMVFAILWAIMISSEANLEMKRSKKGPKKATPSDWVCSNGIMAARSTEEHGLLRTKASLRKLRIAAIVTGLLMVAMLITGKQIGSLALFGDGIHLLGDVTGYFCLFFATIASQWEPGKVFTYGYARAELLCSLAAVALQYHEALEIAGEAYERVEHSVPMQLEAGKAIVALSILSTLVNLGLVMFMADTGGSCGHNHGDMAVRMACIHIGCDVGQNLIVLVTGCVLWVKPDWQIVDPMSAIFFLAMLLVSTLPRVWEITRVLMQAAPDDVDVEQIRKDLLAIDGVQDVQELKVWSLSPGQVAATANVFVMSEPMDVLDKAIVIMQHKYALSQSTLQVSDDDPPESPNASLRDATD